MPWYEINVIVLDALAFAVVLFRWHGRGPVA